MAEVNTTAPEPEVNEVTTQTEPQQTEPATEPGKGKQKAAEKTFTEADVERIVKERLARERKANEEKQAEAAKLAAMNEKERTDYQIKQLTAKLAEYEARENRAAMAKEAAAMLSEKGLTGIPDELISPLISDDAEQTKKAVESFASTFQTAVDSAVKARLAGTTPKTGGTVSSVTKSEILAIKNDKERQKAIRDHIELFR